MNFGADVGFAVLPPVGTEGVAPKVPPLLAPPRPAAGGINVLPVLLDPALPVTPDDGVLVVGAVEPEPVVEAPELGVPDVVGLPLPTLPLLGRLPTVVLESTTVVGSTGGVGVGVGIGVGVGRGGGGPVGPHPKGLRHCGGSTVPQFTLQVGPGVGFGVGVGGGGSGLQFSIQIAGLDFIKVLSKTPPINVTLCASCIAPHLPVLMFAQPAASIFFWASPNGPAVFLVTSPNPCAAN